MVVAGRIFGAEGKEVKRVKMGLKNGQHFQKGEECSSSSCGHSIYIPLLHVTLKDTAEFKVRSGVR